MGALFGGIIGLYCYQSLPKWLLLTCMVLAAMLGGALWALIPALFIVVLKLLPLPREMYEVCFVVALMPAAVASALVTRLYGGDGEFASQSVVITTVLSLFSMPLLIKLM